MKSPLCNFRNKLSIAGETCFTLIFLFGATANVALASTTTTQPLLRIEQAQARGDLSAVEAALQQTYFLLDDPRYEKDRFGSALADTQGLYDCSATVIQRDIHQQRLDDRNFDPYGFLWKAWIDEADRVRKQGDSIPLGTLAGHPIRLLFPHEPRHERAAPYRRIAQQLKTLLADFNSAKASSFRALFGDMTVRPWPEALTWPPQFLQKQTYYLDSYFDHHPIFDAGRTKRWKGFLESFLQSVGVRQAKTNKQAKKSSAWTWVLSDRVQKNTLVWGPEQESLLFLSRRCVGRVIQDDWKDASTWSAVLQESLLQELFLAFYLNTIPKAFRDDPVADAVAQGFVQSILAKTGPLYSQGPFFAGLNQLSLADLTESGAARLSSAPLWNFFYRREGPEFLQRHFKKNKMAGNHLMKALNQKNESEEMLWSAFMAWALGLQETPAALRADVVLSKVSSNFARYPGAIELKPIVPPKGAIGAALTDLKPASFRLFHGRIKQPEKIHGLRIRWEPAQAQLSGYLFLANGRQKGLAAFLDYAPMKPGATHQITFDPAQPPTEAFFVVIYRGQKIIPASDVQLQITVVPKSQAPLGDVH